MALKSKRRRKHLCSTMEMPLTKKVDIEISSEAYFRKVLEGKKINFMFSNADVFVDRGGEEENELKIIVQKKLEDMDDGEPVTITVHHKNEGRVLMGITHMRKQNDTETSEK